MSQITALYQGDLHTLCTHLESGETLQTDAPKDNQGKGEFFSPTDLLATSLGSCMLTIMGIAAKKYQVDLTGSKAVVEKTMSTTLPRRIAELDVAIHVPTQFEPAVQEGLERAALACPVHESLHPEIKQTISFTWGPHA